MTDYFFFSGWIANLGVVPLFLLAFFLFEPEALAFAALLFSVIAVLETINNHPYQGLIKRKKGSNPHFLQTNTLLVKKILASVLLFSLWPSSPLQAFPSIVLSIGEQREFDLSQVKKFSLGNKDILAAKVMEDEKILLIKAKKLGYSGLILWPKGGKKGQQYQVYVVKKNLQSDLIEIQTELSRMGLKASSGGGGIRLSGEIRRMESYFYVTRLKKNLGEKLHLETSLSKELRNQLIAQVYKILFKANYFVKCEEDQGKILCFYNRTANQNVEILNFVREKYQVSFLPQTQFSPNKNYLLKLKFVQIEQLSGKEHSFGLYQMNGNIKKLFDEGLMSLIGENKIMLRDLDLDVSTLASPEVVLRVGKKNEIQIGMDIPYESFKKDSENTVIDWKFAGLKVNFVLNESGPKLGLDYRYELTGPGPDRSITGSKGNGSVMLKEQAVFKLFQVSFRAVGKEQIGFPILSKIPLLGNLFKAKSEYNNFKKLEVYAYLEEEINELSY